MIFVATKSYACMFTPWSLGNVHMAKSCKGGERVPDALKSDLPHNGEKADRKTSTLRDWGRVNNTEKRFEAESEKGQGPHRVVEMATTTTMMMVVVVALFICL
jgi:hypothetical protein